MKKLHRSKLSRFETEVRGWHEDGCSYREIAARLKREFGLDISHNAVYSFLKTRERRQVEFSLFYEGLPEDIKSALLKQLNILWTHNSTAIEGNALMN